MIRKGVIRADENTHISVAAALVWVAKGSWSSKPRIPHMMRGCGLEEGDPQDIRHPPPLLLKLVHPW